MSVCLSLKKIAASPLMAPASIASASPTAKEPFGDACGIAAVERDAQRVPRLLDENGVGWNTIGCCCWQHDYPYVPKAEFRIAYTDEAFLVHYRASEVTVRAKYGADDGKVWTDSCMEMFLSPCPEDGSYYNLECNCIGAVLLGYHDADGNKSRAAYDVTAGISRWASLGRSPFAEHEAEGPWEVALIVPFACYWRHAFRPEAGTQMRGNFYKCGDELRTPHFLSWAPIEWEKPNFHLPQFFGQLCWR